MLDDLEERPIQMPQKFSLKEMLREDAFKPQSPDMEAAEQAEADTPASALPSLDELTPLPTPGDPYKAFSRPSNKPVPTLHCLLADGTIRGFSWAGYDGIDYLPADRPGEGPVLIVRFAGIFSREVVIAGRHLELLHAYLSHQRLTWVRELPKGKLLKEDGSAVITGMVIRPVEPEGR